MRRFQDLPGRHDHGFGVAPAGEQGAYGIADNDARNAVAHRIDDAGAFQPENVARARRRRIAARPLGKVGA